MRRICCFFLLMALSQVSALFATEAALGELLLPISLGMGPQITPTTTTAPVSTTSTAPPTTSSSTTLITTTTSSTLVTTTIATTTTTATTSAVTTTSTSTTRITSTTTTSITSTSTTTILIIQTTTTTILIIPTTTTTTTTVEATTTTVTSTTTTTAFITGIPRGFVEQPTPNSRLSGNTNISGWAVVVSGNNGGLARRIDLFVDGAFSVQLADRVARTDVQQYLAGQGITAPSTLGFSGIWNTRTVADGLHSLSIRAADAAALSQETVVEIALISVITDNGIAPSTTTSTTSSTTTMSTTTSIRPTTTTTNTTTTTSSTLPAGGSTIYFPRAIATSTSLTGIAVVNLSNESAQLTMRAYTDKGLLVSGSQVANPASQVLSARNQMAYLLSEIFGSGFVLPSGWVELFSPNSGLAGFFLEFNPAVYRLMGADALTTLSREWIIPQIDVGVDIINPNDAAAELSLAVRNSGGVLIDGIILPSIAARGHYGVSMEQLLSRNSLVSSGHMRITASQPVLVFVSAGFEPISGGRATGYNAFTNEEGSQLLYVPQYAVGGPYQSKLSLVNFETKPTTLALRWISDNGTPLGTPANLSLSQMGTAEIEGAQPFGLSAGGAILQGYLEITSTASRVAGVVNFRDIMGLTFSASLHTVSGGQRRVLYSQLAQNDTYFTGFAALNAGPSPGKIVLKAFSAAGRQLGTAELNLVPAARASLVLSQLLVGLSNIDKGYFTLESDVPIASFAVFGTHDSRVLAAIPPYVY